MNELFEILPYISHLVDSGLVVLIWMVQLIIYPSFLYYKKENLVYWHQKYTSRIAIIVVPLMVFELFYGIIITYNTADITNLIYISVVIFLWIFTFLGFAPLHLKISNNEYDQKLLKKLIFRNWIRVFLWSFLLIFNLFFS